MMERFSFLLTLVSVVVGLALTDLLGSLHRLLRARASVRWHWVPLVWAATMGLVLLQYWWAFFSFGRDPYYANFFAFAFHLLGLVFLFLGASAVLPDDVPPDGVDLLEQYLAQRRYFFSLGVLGLTQTAIEEALRGTSVPLALHVIKIAAVAVLISLARSERRRYHAVATLGVLILLLAFILLSTLRIGESPFSL